MTFSIQPYAADTLEAIKYYDPAIIFREEEKKKKRKKEKNATFVFHGGISRYETSIRYGKSINLIRYVSLCNVNRVQS